MFSISKYQCFCAFVILSASHYTNCVMADEDASTPILNWYPNKLLSEQQLNNQYSFCNGRYIPEDITPLTHDNIEASANSSEIKLNKQLKLFGDVLFLQKDRKLYADEAVWNMQTLKGEFRGNARLFNPEISVHAEQANIEQVNQNQQTKLKNISFNNAQYSFPQQHLRGSSEHIDIPNKNLMLFDNNTLTYCEPGNNDWDLRSSEVEIDYDEGVARSWHTRLRINEVPIFYFPYFSFPIDDRRITGFLSPEFTLNKELNLSDVQIPFYINFYANLDATLTAHYIRNQGILWESELRHKTRLFGDGQLDYKVMGTNSFNDKKRWLFAYKQQGSMLPNLTHTIDYNQISDNLYFEDMEGLKSTNRESYLTQKAQLEYTKSPWQAYVLAEQYQTINENVALSGRPYFRLPQIRFAYQPTKFNGFQFQQIIQATYFTRVHRERLTNGVQTLTGINAVDGQRLLLDSSVAYPLKSTYGFLIPKLDLRYRAYQLGRIDADYQTAFFTKQSKRQFIVPKFTLDSGLFFERDTSIFNIPTTQTLEPRVFWAYSPKIDKQFLIPTFDTSDASMSYAGLFSGDRFNGGDRLADLNQISLGVSSAFLNASGREFLRFNLGKIRYLRDREVQLKGQNIGKLDKRSQSNLLGEANWQPSTNLKLYSHLDYDTYLNTLAQQRYGINYENQKNQMVNLSLSRIKTYSATKNEYAKNTYQLEMSSFWAITDSWALFARQLRDLRKYKKTEYQPVSPVLEAMLGLEYQNCCWKIQALYKESSPVKRLGGEEFSTDKQVSYLLNFQFKGLGTVGSGINPLLNKTINGYSRRRYHDY